MSAPTLPRLQHTYNPRGAAREVLTCRAPEVLLAGPAGTGKSRAALEKLHFMCLMNPGMRALGVRKTLASFTSTGLVTYEQHVAAESIRAGDVKWFGGSQKEPAAFRYSNKSVFVVGGMDNATKIMSSEYDLIYVQEAVELEEDDWEKCTTRLRNGKVSFQQLIADCNPDAPHHWLRLRCDKGLTVELHSRHEDNPVYFDDDGNVTEVGADYMAKLDRLTGVRYLRLRKGIWAAAEGVVYDEFDPRIHVIDRFEIPESWSRYWSIDFGYVHPFVCQFWAEDHDGRLYLYREIYHTGKTVDLHARDILDCVSDVPPGVDPERCRPSQRIWREPKPRDVVCDHDAGDRALLERELGVGCRKATKHKSEGIQLVQARMRLQGDGKPRIYFLRDSVVRIDPQLIEEHKPTSTIQEMSSYVWDIGNGKKPKEEPVKEHDHGCLVAGTMVLTENGLVPIELVQAGDRVHTRAGLRQVLAAGMTSAEADVLRVVLSDGNTLVGTGNHPVWVDGRGWTRLDALRYADRMVVWQSPSGSKESPSAATPTPSSGPTASTTPLASPTDSAAWATCTRRSGSTLMDPFLTAAKSITSTSTPTTTAWTTLSASPSMSTTRRIASAAANVGAHQQLLSTSARYAPSLPHGIAPTWDATGIANMPPAKDSDMAPSEMAYANSAVPDTSSPASMGRSGSVPTVASLGGGGSVVLTTSAASAPSVVPGSPSTGTRPRDAAGTYVLSVCELDGRVPVFNLTVADCPEFFANNILVHNCDAMRYEAVERDGGRPRVRSMG